MMIEAVRISCAADLVRTVRELSTRDLAIISYLLKLASPRQISIRCHTTSERGKKTENRVHNKYSDS